jgi:hypothetical protein
MKFSIGVFLTTFSINLFAITDQIVTTNIIKKLGYENDRAVKDKCFDLNYKLQSRIQNAVVNSDLNLQTYQLAGEAKYSVKRNLHGRGINQAYLHTCDLYIRLTSENIQLKMEASVNSYTGRNKLAACQNEQQKFEALDSVLYTEINNTLFSCKVEPVIYLK